MKKSLSTAEKKTGKEELLYSEPLWIGQLLGKAAEKAGLSKGKMTGRNH